MTQFVKRHPILTWIVVQALVLVVGLLLTGCTPHAR